MPRAMLSPNFWFLLILPVTGPHTITMEELSSQAACHAAPWQLTRIPRNWGRPLDCKVLAEMKALVLAASILAPSAPVHLGQPPIGRRTDAFVKAPHEMFYCGEPFADPSRYCDARPAGVERLIPNRAVVPKGAVRD
jgi:hypothetical protein